MQNCWLPTRQSLRKVKIIFLSVEEWCNPLDAGSVVYIVFVPIITVDVADINDKAFLVPGFRNNEGFRPFVTVDNGVQGLNEWFQHDNPYISTLMGCGENFLLRFGDVSCDPDQLQLAGGKTGAPSWDKPDRAPHATTFWLTSQRVNGAISLCLWRFSDYHVSERWADGRSSKGYGWHFSCLELRLMVQAMATTMVLSLSDIVQAVAIWMVVSVSSVYGMWLVHRLNFSIISVM